MSDKTEPSLLEHATAMAVSMSLDEAGASVHCWRLRNEPDKSYAWRLAIHLQEEITVREQLLANVLSLSRHVPCKTKE